MEKAIWNPPLVLVTNNRNDRILLLLVLLLREGTFVDDAMEEQQAIDQGLRGWEWAGCGHKFPNGGIPPALPYAVCTSQVLLKDDPSTLHRDHAADLLLLPSTDFYLWQQHATLHALPNYCTCCCAMHPDGRGSGTATFWPH